MAVDIAKLIEEEAAIIEWLQGEARTRTNPVTYAEAIATHVATLTQLEVLASGRE